MNNHLKLKVIVTSVIKDEGWMMERFLTSCSLFADHIIIHDESTGLDRTREIYKKYSKVILYTNDAEPIRHDIKRRFVFSEARRLFPDNPKLIIPLDGDELLSANILESAEWNQVLLSKPGTLIHLQWVNLWHGVHQYKVDHPELHGNYNRKIWMDDGISEIPEVGEKGFHMAYTPLDAKEHLYLKEIVCLHFQFCNWDRMESKHRYYQAHEKVILRKLSNLAIWRIYNQNFSKNIKTRTSMPGWFNMWEKIGLEFDKFEKDPIYFHDIIVLKYIVEHGVDSLKWQNIWNAPWDAIVLKAKSLGIVNESYQFKFPKTTLGLWLWRKYLEYSIHWTIVRWFEKKIFRSGFFYNPSSISEVLKKKLFGRR